MVRSSKSSSDDSLSYAERTRDDANAIKQFIHNDRFDFATSIFQQFSSQRSLSTLDFGAGDGELIRRLAKLTSEDLVAYEPAPTFQAQLAQNLSQSLGARIVSNLSQITDQFDIIFCLEVLEHLPRESLNSTIETIKHLLKDDGVFVLSVPHEIHLPALAKGIFRMVRRFGAFDAQPINVFRATMGWKIYRPLSQMSDHLPYHFDHIGFDYRELEALCATHFSEIKRTFRPIPIVGSLFNSEVYFILRK